MNRRSNARGAQNQNQQQRVQQQYNQHFVPSNGNQQQQEVTFGLRIDECRPFSFSHRLLCWRKQSIFFSFFVFYYFTIILVRFSSPSGRTSSGRTHSTEAQSVDQVDSFFPPHKKYSYVHFFSALDCPGRGPHRRRRFRLSFRPRPGPLCQFWPR